MQRKKLGEVGERIARQYLKKRGYHVLETNFRCLVGEIDIVARQGEELVFVEVRTRKSTEFGTPEESVTPSKQARLINVAYTYLQTRQDLPPSWRIDVLAVELDRGGKVSRVELIENAIGQKGPDVPGSFA